MRVLFLGDIVGRTARNEVITQTISLKDEYKCDFVVTNCPLLGKNALLFSQ